MGIRENVFNADNVGFVCDEGERKAGHSQDNRGIFLVASPDGEEEKNSPDKRAEEIDELDGNGIKRTAAIVRNAVGLFSYFLLQSVSGGMAFSMGVIYIEVIKTYEGSKLEASLLPSLCLGITYGLGGLGGVAVKKLGLRLSCIVGSLVSCSAFVAAAFVYNLAALIVLAGGLAGCGFCLISIVSYVGATLCFRSRRTLCLAIASFGTMFGATVHPLLLTRLIKLYGLRGNFLAMAGMVFLACILSLLSGSMPEVIDGKPRDNKEKVNFSIIFKNKVLALFFLSLIGVGLGSTLIGVVIIDYGLGGGYSLEASTLFLTVYNASNAVGRILFGFISIFFKVSALTVYCVSALLAGSLIVALPFIKNYAVVMVILACIGINIGGNMTMALASLLEFNNVQGYPLFCGILSSSFGLGDISSGPIAGFVADLNGSYGVSFVMGGLVLISFTSFLTIALLVEKCFRSRRSWTVETDAARTVTRVVSASLPEDDEATGFGGPCHIFTRGAVQS